MRKNQISVSNWSLPKTKTNGRPAPFTMPKKAIDEEHKQLPSRALGTRDRKERFKQKRLQINRPCNGENILFASCAQ